jgi:hypothetical protein
MRSRGRDRVSAKPQDGSEEVEQDSDEYLDGQEEDSFPASDPHSDWSGPRPEPE